VIREGKGKKDRVTMLPERVRSELKTHLLRVKGRHEEDLAGGGGTVYLPYALERKYIRFPFARHALKFMD
jgi:hypothetical protein